MFRHRHIAALAPLLLVAACGGTTAATLQLGTSTAASRTVAAPEGAADASLGVWSPAVTYIAGDALDDPKWTEGIGKRRAWKYVTPQSPEIDLGRIASVLVVGGSLKEDKVNTGLWSTGDTVGGASFGSWGDEHSRWWWYGSAAGAPSRSGSTSACAPDTKECTVTPDTVPPAHNLPGTTEARTNALRLLEKIGVDTSPAMLATEVTVDDWSVRVRATALHDGEETWMQSWYFGFGSEARLTDASGSLVSLQKADSYPVITPVEAVARLNSTGIASWGTATRAVAVDSSAPDAASGAAPTEVTLVSARLSVVDWALSDGTVMLLPAWALADTDGNEVRVVAVADEFISWPTPDTAVIEPGTAAPPATDGVSTGGGSGSSGGSSVVPSVVIRDEDAQKLVGLSEDEAAKVATGQGWTVRIAERDGEAFMLTTDFRTDRVNLSVTAGTVTAVTVG
jgi:hypothetical protein